MKVDDLATQIMALDWKARKDWTVDEQANRYGELQEMIAAYLSARSAEPVAWRHKKRGGLYEIVGEAQIQTSHPLEDYELVVVYRSLNTPDIDDPKSPMKGELWARPKAEFYDGRFEAAAIRKGPGE